LVSASKRPIAVELNVNLFFAPLKDKAVAPPPPLFLPPFFWCLQFRSWFLLGEGTFFAIFFLFLLDAVGFQNVWSPLFFVLPNGIGFGSPLL